MPSILPEGTVSADGCDVHEQLPDLLAGFSRGSADAIFLGARRRAVGVLVPVRIYDELRGERERVVDDAVGSLRAEGLEPSSVAAELAGLGRKDFVARLAYFSGEINAIHPFREGNGRAQWAFLGQLARGAGWRIAWSELVGAENDRASAVALQGDLGPLTVMLDSIVRPL